MLKCNNVGAMASVSPSKANFDAQYSSLKGQPTNPKWLLLLMIWPLFLAFMLGSTAWIRRRAPKKFTSNKSLAILVGIHSNTDVTIKPALLTVEKE